MNEFLKYYLSFHIFLIFSISVLITEDDSNDGMISNTGIDNIAIDDILVEHENCEEENVSGEENKLIRPLSIYF